MLLPSPLLQTKHHQNRYQGEFNQEGKRHGVGTMLFADGAAFSGRWDGGAWLQSAADPARCRASGGGLARAVAGEAAAFEVAAFDEDGNARLSGGDVFHVTLLRDTAAAGDIESSGGGGESGGGGNDAERAGDSGAAAGAAGGVAGGAGDGRDLSAAGAAPLAVAAAARVEDRGDGRYGVTYRLEAAGAYLIAITDGALPSPPHPAFGFHAAQHLHTLAQTILFFLAPFPAIFHSESPLSIASPPPPPPPPPKLS